MKKIFFIILISCFSFVPISKAQQSQTYFYVVTAVDSSGNESAFSNEASATVSANHNKVNLNWSESGTVAGFNMYRSKVSGSGYVKINTTLILTTSTTDTITFPQTPTQLTTTVP